MIKDVIEANNHSSKILAITLIALVSINILVEVLRFIFSIVMSNREKKNKRHLLIAEKKIKVLEQLFQMMDSLTLLDKSEETSLLQQIREIDHYMTKNKIYIEKTFQKSALEILDYFRGILTDYRQKSIEKETKLFENFADEFNR